MIILPKESNFIAGVCHARDNLDLIEEANIGWNRGDVPFPFQPGKFGELTPAYIAYRNKVKKYADRGIKTMCVTPYPRAFAKFGIDPATPEGLETVKKILKWMAQDMKAAGLRGYQITNELNVFHFRVPLTLEQAPAFIIAGIKGVREGDPDAILGYNSAGVGPDVQRMLEEIKPCHGMVDYMGVDSYRGTWSDGEPDDIIAEIDATYGAAGLPVLVQEFGFSSAGEIFAPEDALAYVKSTGFDSIEAVYENPEGFVERLPYHLAKHVMESPKEDWAKNALGYMPHMLRKWPGGSKKYRHTNEGQAAFYDEALEKMLAHPQVCGAFVYSWSDPDVCFNCRYPNCPCETAWGITTPSEEPKPAYYAIQKHFAQTRG